MKKKVQALILSICLILIGTQSVYADMSDPVDASNSKQESVSVISETPTETPTGTPTATPTVIPTETPTVIPTETPMETPAEGFGNAIENDVVSAQLSDDEMNCTVTLSHHTAVSGEKMSVAVWSDTNGQDDLRWYDMTKSGDVYTASVPIMNHKTEGVYYAHVYCTVNGKLSFVNERTFTVSGISYSDIVVENIDNNAGTCDVVIRGITSKSGIESVFVPVWSKADQSDIKWYAASKLSNGDYGFTMNLANHKYNIGKYNIHVYATTGNKITAFVGCADVTFTSGDVSFVIDKSSNIKVNATNVSYPAGIKSVSFAVWSEVNGQDDLRWFDGVYAQSSQTATLTYKATNFKSYGKYYVHLYGTNAAGKFLFLGSTTYDVESPSGNVSAVMDEKGSFDIAVSDAKCNNGIKGISVAVWSKADQSDMVWYAAKKNAAGSYTVKSDISKHKYNIGTYQAHAYLTDSNGVFSFIGSDTMTYNFNEAAVSVTENEKGYTVNTSNITLPGTISRITYAVWSEINGQDDLKWYDGSYSAGTSSYELAASKLRFYGKYYVHAYAYNTSGGTTFIGGTTFEIHEPHYESVDAVVTSAADGTFTITMKGLANNAGIASVSVPVWSKSDQSDIVWYAAEKSGDDYVVNSDISRHKYNIGTYNAHVYISYANGMYAWLTAAQFELNVSNDGINIDGGQNERYYTASISNLIVPGKEKSVSFAVWSEKNGQDDLRWYEASADGNSYSAKIDIKNHKTAGKYHVHVYCTNKAGAALYIGSSGFDVNSSATASMSFVDGNMLDGSFEVTIKLANATSTVESLSVPVWFSNNQSDLRWYPATKRSDDTFTVQVNSANHKYNLGTYKIHAYAVFSNGISAFVGSSTYDFIQDNYINVVKPSEGKRTVTLRYPSASAKSVSFAIWSNANGQDDIKWYGASKQSNTWVATMDTVNHRDSGTYCIHCYVDGKLASYTTCSVSQSEMKKNGWYYENGYKFYYSNGVKQTDVRGIIGAQSSYRIHVNRTCNTVTVYAKDGNNGYIIPVCAFACSVGLPQTPTYTGTYSLGAKYRWKMLMGPSWGQYASAVSGQSGVYFHSVAGSNTTSYNISAVEYNKLGSAASHGCIRLNVRDAKWIYDNVPSGSTIYIYDSATPGPLGKPATIKIPAGQNWDPTDPNI